MSRIWYFKNTSFQEQPMEQTPQIVDAMRNLIKCWNVFDFTLYDKNTIISKMVEIRIKVFVKSSTETWSATIIVNIGAHSEFMIPVVYLLCFSIRSFLRILFLFLKFWRNGYTRYNKNIPNSMTAFLIQLVLHIEKKERERVGEILHKKTSQI